MNLNNKKFVLNTKIFLNICTKLNQRKDAKRK